MKKIIPVYAPALYLILFLLNINISVRLYAENSAKVYPIRINNYASDLEPSGLALYKDKLLFVSDNKSDTYIFQLIPENNFYEAGIFITFNRASLSKIYKKEKLDLEGIVCVSNDFYCIDERNRYVYRINQGGMVDEIRNDIKIFCNKNNIYLSEEKNAGFEGIAYDQKRDIFFIANERDDALIFILKLNKNQMTAVDYFSFSSLMNDSRADLSDIFFSSGYLYALHRNAGNVVKLDPYKKRMTASFSYSAATGGLYKSKKGHGFAEGLALTNKKIFIALDSGGKKMMGKDIGQNGALVIADRPEGF